MASGSSARLNSGSQGFDFASDDILCSYDDFNTHDGINNGTAHQASDKDFHKSRMTRSSFVPAPVYNQPEDSFSQEVINAVERSMKKNSDNILRFLEGISSRLSQLELYCYNVDKSTGEMRSEMLRDHGEVDSKLKTIEKNIGEVQRSLQILRDKQELAEAHKELAKLHLAQKESPNPSYSQQNEERSSTPAIEPQKVSDSSDTLSQKLALVLPHQIPPSQPSNPSRVRDQSRPVVPPPQAQPQNIAPQQHYYVPSSQMPAHAQQPQDQQGQYATPDSHYPQSQMQDMSRLPPQPVQPNVNQVPSQSQVHQFPQYQQQWPLQLSQQQLQPQPQPQPATPHIRPQSGPVYPSYQASRPASPAPPDTIPGSLAAHLQFSGVPQSGKNRAEATVYGYGGRPIQQQPPTQRMKGNFGAQANDGYASMGSHPAYTPASGYMMYGNEEVRPHPPPPQPHFSQGGYPPGPQNSVTRNPNQSQFVRNQPQPYSDLVEKLVNMGFRGEHALNVIQMMEDSGQHIDFNSVLDRMSAQSSGSSHRGWSG